jgi:hypothetical protein
MKAWRDMCFISKAGRVAHGTLELRKLYRAMFSYKPHLKLEVRKIIHAGDDLALVIVEWASKPVLASGEIEALSGIARRGEKTGRRHMEAIADFDRM